jgi:hypothetical protein
VTDDEIVALGSFCETLMCHSAWAVIVEQFEQHCFQLIMTTNDDITSRTKKGGGIYKTNYCNHRLGRRRLRTLMTNSLGPLMIRKTMTSPTSR